MVAKKSISRIFSVLFVFIFMLSVMPLQAVHAAVVRYAKPGGTGDCSNWANACELQTALTGSISGQEIWVAAGTYKPTTGTDRSATFQLKNGVALYGGFAGTETVRTQRNLATNVTILSGDIGTVSDNNDNSYHVVTGATGATLDGFTITAGYANGGDGCPGKDCGGGIFNTSGSSPMLTNVTFSGNSAYTAGGGMGNYDSSPTLTNVSFSGNSTYYYGGGMCNLSYSYPTLTNVTFSGNSAGYGGGMYNDGQSSPNLTNVTISGNLADFGGGMYNETYSSPTLTNVTFSGNSASFYGGGMFNFEGNHPKIRNTIFWDNTATINGAQIYNYYVSSTPSVSDSVVEGGCPAGSTCTNIIPDNPNLGSLGNYGGFTQTIPLLAGSSAIDATSSNCPTTDQRGVPRSNPICDIGAYEYVDTTKPVVNTFTVTTLSNSLNIPILAFTATDDLAVTGYLITTSSAPPAVGTAGWTSTAPTTYTVASDGSYTLYPWAKDAAGNVSVVFVSPRQVMVDTTNPTVTSIIRAGPNPTSAASVNFTVTFSESVTGVDVSDFNLTKTGVSGATVSGVSGSGSVYTVTVNTAPHVSGVGTIRLDVVDNNSIVDAALNPLGGVGLGDGSYTSGETYDVRFYRAYIPLVLKY